MAAVAFRVLACSKWACRDGSSRPGTALDMQDGAWVRGHCSQPAFGAECRAYGLLMLKPRVNNFK